MILAESAVFALSASMPRPVAEELVKKACAAAAAESKPLIQILQRLAKDSLKEGAVDWQKLADPKSYLGETETLIGQVLQQAKKIF